MIQKPKRLTLKGKLPANHGLKSCYVLERPNFRWGYVHRIFDVVHGQAFHGESTRAGVEWPMYDNYRPGITTEERKSLSIQRTGVSIPPIFWPGSQLVVSAEVKKFLSDFKNIEFLKVKFTKLVNFSIALRKFDYPKFKDVENIFSELKDDPRLYAGLGDYYELICENPYKMEKSKGPEFEFTNEWDNAFTFPAAMLNSHPVFSAGDFVCNSDFYARIEPFLDKTFFEITELQIPK